MLGPVAREIEETLASERSAAIRTWQQAWTDERYAMVMTTLAGWLVKVPLAEEPVNGRTVLRKAQRKARRRLERAGNDPEQLHAARKSAKRLRYAAELLTDVEPRAAMIVKAAKKEQTVLGDHQDLMVAADFLQRAGRAGRHPSRAQRLHLRAADGPGRGAGGADPRPALTPGQAYAADSLGQ